MSVFQTDIRKVCLVGPPIGSEGGADSSYLWVAHLTALYDQDAKADHGAMRNPSLRVLAEAAEAREGFSALQTKKVAFHDPKLLSVAVRPQVGWWSSLFFDALPSGQRAKAISGAIGNRREDEAFSVVTAVPALARTTGKWPDKTSNELQVPPLRLTAGAIPILVTQETDKQHKNKVGYWTLLRAKQSAGDNLSLFGDGSGVFVSATPGAFKVLKDSLDIADDQADPNSKESADITEKELTSGKPPRFAVDLTPDGIEFEAKLRFLRGKEVDVRLRLEVRGKDNFVLILLKEQTPFFRNGLDRVIADLRRKGYPVVLDLRPGTPRIVWSLKYESEKLTLPDVRAFVLEADTVRVGLLGDPPKGAVGRTVARLSNPQASVTWGGASPSQIRITAGDKKNTAVPVAILGVHIDAENEPKRFDFQLGNSAADVQPTGDVAVIVDTSVAGSTRSVFLALERGVVQLPRPSEEVSISTAGETNAFEGLVHLRSGSLVSGVSTTTVDAATGAEVVIKCDETRPAETKVETRLYGAVGALDGYVWAAAAAPSGEEIVPTLDNGPISLRSLPVLFGEHPRVKGYKGKIEPIITGKGPVEITIEVPKPTKTDKDKEIPGAVIWAPHPKTMAKAGPELPPVVAAVSMTRTVPNATEPSRTRDLVPVAYKPIDGQSVVNLTLTVPQGGSALPICTTADNVMRFGWPNADVPLAAVTLPGVEYAATDEAEPTLRFDLPSLDDFHASATLRRKREEAKPDSEKATPHSVVTADTPEKLETFWKDQSRRRGLMRSADDIFWRGTAVGSVAMPFAMSDTVVFDVKNGSNQDPLPLGSYKINDVVQFGEDALAGLSANYDVNAASPSKLVRKDGGPIKGTGFAIAPYEVTIGEKRPAASAAGNAWQDTRGHAFAKTFEKKTVAILRQTHWQSATDEVDVRSLITSLHATKVQIANGVKAFLAFRDLPTTLQGGVLEFMPLDKAPADPYSSRDLPSSVYEWRHYEVANSGKSAAHDIGYGPLRLKPIRLQSATFSNDGFCNKALIDYRVDLAEIDSESDSKSQNKVPFGPDDVYRTGSVITVEYEWQADSGSLKPQRIAQGQIGLRVSAPMVAGGTKTSVTVDVSFGFEVNNNCLVIAENGGKLELKLFGFTRTFENAAVTFENGVLTIKATSTTPISDGLAIKEVKLTLCRDSSPKLDVDATLSAAPIEASSALVLHIGKTVNFYGAHITAQDAFGVDHTTGVVSVRLSEEASKPLKCEGALARGFPVATNAGGSMVFILNEPAKDTPFTQTMGAARVDLHIQGESDFEARFLLQVEDKLTTRRRLSVSLGIPKAESVIAWPTASIDGDNAASKAAIKDLMSATSLAWSTAGSFMIEVAVSAPTSTIIHSVHPTLKAFDIPEDALQIKDKEKSEWILFEPVRVKAVTTHVLERNKQTLLSWTAIDDVTLIDVNRFVELAKDPTGYAFSPRYQDPGKGGTSADPKEVPSAGIVKTASFGRAIGNYLKGKSDSFGSGLALFGGAVHEAVLGKDLALTFGLPWISFFSDTKDAAKWPLPSIPQAPESGASQTFTVSLFDLAAAVPHQRNGVAPYPISIKGQRVVDLMGEMKRLKVDSALRVADLAFASNLPAYPKKDPSKKDPVVPDFKSPIFWRTLMALKRLFEVKDAKTLSFLTVFGDPKAERAIRIDLVADDLPNGASQAGKARVFVLDRKRVEVSDLPATLPFETVSMTDDARRRVLLDARTAIVDPLAVKVARAVADEQEDDPATEHHEGGFPIDPIRRQAVTAGRALRPAKKDTIHPAPSLGWPEFGQLGDAVVSSLSIGAETPLQDSSVAWAGRARRFGGTLVAAKGEKVPASKGETPAASPLDQAPASFQTAAFLVVGRRVVFARDAGAGGAPTVTAPPDRALTPVPPRARAPVPKVIQAAFAADVDKLVGNFFPGHYEFVSTGVRPGAMVFEHTGVLHTSNAREFDLDHARFGRPAERAPVVWTQGRAPRSTGLPKVKDLDRRRRTFIGENILDGANIRELALIKGPASVIRYLPSTIEEGGDSAFAKKTVAIFVRVETSLTELDSDFAGGKIKLVFERPLPDDHGSAKPLSTVLGDLGFLSQKDSGNRIPPVCMLTIGDTVACANMPEHNTQSKDGNNTDKTQVTATIGFEPGFGAIRQALLSATSDTQALLHIRAGAKVVSSGGASAELPPPLLAGPPRTLSIRLPVLPAVEPYLPIPTATLAFGDPAYDRELAGPAKTATWRDPNDGESVVMLSLDRPAYDVGETIHFAVGKLDPKFLDPKNLVEASPVLPWKSEGEWDLRVAWMPKSKDNRPTTIPLSIADTKVADEKKGPTYKINGGAAYGVSIDALRMRDGGAKPAFRDGDRLSFTVKRGENPDLTVAVTIVEEPVIAPSSAVYSLVTLDTVDGKKIATPILYASAPLPTTLEFPDILTDLARGHVRRRGLFVWRFVPRTAKPTAALVKIDRTGGGQIPSDISQFATMQ